MSIQNMHYDFKMKLNKIDSQKYRNFRVQEIDWKLNQALRIRIKTIAQPRFASQLGVEVNQRTIQDIRPLVVENKRQDVAEFGDNKSYSVALPDDHWFTLSLSSLGNKGRCTELLDVNEVTHDDRVEGDSFAESSFEWREINAKYYSAGIRLYTDGSFSLSAMYIDYIKKVDYIHNAAASQTGQYKLADGTLLTGTKSSPFSSDIEDEIVDLAVLITTGNLQIPDYQLKMANLKLND